MTMLETKEEIAMAIANNCPLSFDALMNCYLAVNTYISLYGSHDIKVGVKVE